MKSNTPFQLYSVLTLCLFFAATTAFCADEEIIRDTVKETAPPKEVVKSESMPIETAPAKLAPEEVEGPPADQPFDYGWLDGDKKTYVIQNRKFRKAQRLVLGASMGTGIGQPYRTVLSGMPRVGFYFSDYWGIEAIALLNSNSANSNFNELNTGGITVPTVRELVGFYGLVFSFSPIYGKLNFFNYMVPMDWNFSIGGGAAPTRVDTNRVAQQPSKYVSFIAGALFVGTGQNFFLTKHWTIRLDFASVFYRAPTYILGYNSGSSNFYNNYFLYLGPSYLF